MRFQFTVLHSNVLHSILVVGLCCFITPLDGNLSHAEEDVKEENVKEEDGKDAEVQAPKIQLAILLDTSGSMQGLITQAQTQLWKIVNEFATTKQNGKVPELEVALYEYGKSSIPASEGYLRMLVPLSDDLDKVSEELFALKTNGGQEYCGQVIQAATSGLKWSENDQDLKCIFIAGNEAFTQGKVDYKLACKEAIEKGITVNTIFCGHNQEGIRTQWQAGAQLADGSYLNIDHNQAVTAIATPQDQQLRELSQKLNGTYVAYGSNKERENRKELQVAQDKLAEKAAPGAGASRALSKASGFYRNSKWDLVDALKDGKTKLKDIKEEELPEEVRKLKPEERAAYVEKKTKEREAIKAEIKKLAEERKTYIAAEMKKQSKSKKKDTLDTAIIQSIREQATKKNFTFEKK